MEKTIEVLVEEAVRAEVKQRVEALVATAFNEKMEDPEFSEDLEMIAGEVLEEQLRVTYKPEPRFKDVFDFVDNFIRPMYPTTRTRLDQVNWSSEWYYHEEVGARLEALWRIYERERVADPEGFLEGFLRQHADYHMRQIMDPEGVFAQCSTMDTPSVPLPAIPCDDGDDEDKE